GRFVTTWQGIVKRRHGADALLDAIEQLQGAPLPASILETEVLQARIDVYDPSDLDALIAAGEVVWGGVEPIGDGDGRIALYLADHLQRLLPPTVRLKPDTAGEKKERLLPSHPERRTGAVDSASGGSERTRPMSEGLPTSARRPGPADPA